MLRYGRFTVCREDRIAIGIADGFVELGLEAWVVTQMTDKITALNADSHFP